MEITNLSSDYGILAINQSS